MPGSIDPNPFTAAELDELSRLTSPDYVHRLIPMARRAIELESRVAELSSALAEIHRTSGRGDGHGTPTETAACVVDAIVTGAIDSAEGAQREKELNARIAELETQLMELEALRALEKHVRASSGKVTYPLRRELADLLKAIDEAREGEAGAKK